MSAQTTEIWLRKWAIDRIREIGQLVLDKDYRAIEQKSSEYGHGPSIRGFVDRGLGFDLEHLDKWSNSMLEEVMDRPFFRKSSLDNYCIVDKLEDYD